MVNAPNGVQPARAARYRAQNIVRAVITMSKLRVQVLFADLADPMPGKPTILYTPQLNSSSEGAAP